MSAAMRESMGDIALSRLPAIMTTWQVLNWIAFRDPCRDSYPMAEDKFLVIWLHSDAVRTLQAMETMIAGAWRPELQDEPPLPPDCLHPAWRPNGREWIEQLRVHVSEREGIDLSLSGLAARLRGEIEAWQGDHRAIDRARHELLEALRAEKLTGEGQEVRDGRSPITTRPAPRLPRSSFVAIQTRCAAHSGCLRSLNGASSAPIEIT